MFTLTESSWNYWGVRAAITIFILLIILIVASRLNWSIELLITLILCIVIFVCFSALVPKMKYFSIIENKLNIYAFAKKSKLVGSMSLLHIESGEIKDLVISSGGETGLSSILLIETSEDQVDIEIVKLSNKLKEQLQDDFSEDSKFYFRVDGLPRKELHKMLNLLLMKNETNMPGI